MAPRKRHGVAKSSDSENDLLTGLGLLAVQPAGDLYWFLISPQSAQFKKKSDNTSLLISELKRKLPLATQQALQKQESNARGAVALKVVFLLGKNDAEKDSDNMGKWFCDCLRKATNADDGIISDLRLMKYRLNTNQGSIGLSIATVKASRGGDREMAQAIAKGLSVNCNIEEPESILKILSSIQECHQKLHAPVNLMEKTILLPNGLLYIKEDL